MSNWLIQSAMPGDVWPAIPSPAAAAALALLRQLEHSEWLDPDVLEFWQLRQVESVLRHAFATVPWYGRTWNRRFDPAAPLTYEAFARLPLLSRRDLQDGFGELKSSKSPPEHGPPQEGRTSGSTGAPVRFLGTRLTGLYWNAFALRDHAWHRRDLTKKLAVIRREAEEQKRARNWGAATAGLVVTGPAVSHTLRADAGVMLDWLLAEQPAYLLTYPSLLAELARLSRASGVRIESLLEVRTLAESLGLDLRALCRDAWGVPLVDLYSASETGHIALQCPQHDHYHVQSEGVLVEVLRDDGTRCTAGETGRVVVTTLHNFATPLVRYDIGDFAVVGARCACGRGLPVLERILGRVRNTLTTADGKRYWPVFGLRALMDAAPLEQYQFVQKTPSHVEARLVTAKALDSTQEAAFRTRVLSQLPDGIELTIVYCERIERSASGKFEEFLSEVSTS